VNASKKVADNIFGGGDADVRFEHVVDIDKVRSNFEERIGGWLRQVGYTGDFHREPKMGGSHYRLHE
jgi:hypothetical protein